MKRFKFSEKELKEVRSRIMKKGKLYHKNLKEEREKLNKILDRETELIKLKEIGVKDRSKIFTAISCKPAQNLFRDILEKHEYLKPFAENINRIIINLQKEIYKRHGTIGTKICVAVAIYFGSIYNQEKACKLAGSSPVGLRLFLKKYGLPTSKRKLSY
ncbi:MAG: hypothetical protein ACTSQ8_08110 [Candidatus Helarchaeota archaeon]